MTAKKRKLFLRAVIIVAVGVMGLGFYCAFINPSSFFSISFSDLLSLLSVLLISFVLSTQYETYDKHATVLYKIIDELLLKLDENTLCNVKNADGIEQTLLMNKRQISSKLDLLSAHSEEYGIKNEIDEVMKMFAEYDRLVSDHINDIDYLSKSTNELLRPIKIMRDKLYETMLKL